MKSIFNAEGNQAIINRIEQLSPITLNEWGTMNVGQMLVHCQLLIKVAFGELVIKRGLMGFLFGKMIKKSIMSDTPFKNNLPTAKEFEVKGMHDFHASKKDLIAMIKRFSDEGHSVIRNPKHPIFGTLTPEEWDYMQWKHLDHHLKQFGV